MLLKGIFSQPLSVAGSSGCDETGWFSAYFKVKKFTNCVKAFIEKRFQEWYKISIKIVVIGDKNTDFDQGSG
jgi:hypothetical protein